MRQKQVLPAGRGVAPPEGAKTSVRVSALLPLCPLDTPFERHALFTRTDPSAQGNNLLALIGFCKSRQKALASFSSVGTVFDCLSATGVAAHLG